MPQNPIIIIGAGFGGLCAALELAKRKHRLGGRQIFLIDRGEHHLYTPLLYEVATGYDPHEKWEETERDIEEELAEGVALSFDYLVRRVAQAGVQFRRGEVTAVDWERHEVVISGEQHLPWSDLVIAVGAETDFYNIPGLREHSFQLKTLRHALAIRRRLRSAIVRKQKGEEAHIQVVVGGAGATGVEFVAELTKFFEKAVRAGMISKSDYSITLVEATHRVLSMFGDPFSTWARERLDKWCMKLYLDSCIKAVEPGKVTLMPRPLRTGETAESLVCEFRTEKQKEIEADVVIWTGGIRAPECLAAWGLPTDPKGRVVVDAHCQVADRRGVYAIGDAAAITDSKTKRPVPALAQTAIVQARVVAENIARGAKGELVAYPFPYLHALVPLGAKYALADVSGYKFRGFWAWIVRQVADLRYFLHILPFGKALHVWLHGARVYTRND